MRQWIHIESVWIGTPAHVMHAHIFSAAKMCVFGCDSKYFPHSFFYAFTYFVIYVLLLLLYVQCVCITLATCLNHFESQFLVKDEWCRAILHSFCCCAYLLSVAYIRFSYSDASHLQCFFVGCLWRLPASLFIRSNGCNERHGILIYNMKWS